MKLDTIIAVSGMSGLQKLLATRNNGLLIESFETGKRQFVSVRKHQFTPLVSIGMYTYTDTTPLEDVFKKVHETKEANPLPDPSDKADDLRAWFKTILPDHDEDKVHINDIRKVIKWYNFLLVHDPGQFVFEESENSEISESSEDREKSEDSENSKDSENSDNLEESENSENGGYEEE